MPNNALFAFEGIDGCGKTTLITAVAAALHAKGYQVSTTQEPWADPIDLSLDPIEQVLRISIDRLHHCKAIAATPGIVLTDRFFLSTLAYQGALGADRELIHILNRRVVGQVKLHKTFWLNLTVEEAITRKPYDGSTDYLSNVAAIYAEEYGVLPWRYCQLNACESVEKLTHQTVREIELRLQYENGSMPNWVYRSDKEKATWDTVKPIF